MPPLPPPTTQPRRPASAPPCRGPWPRGAAAPAKSADPPIRRPGRWARRRRRPWGRNPLAALGPRRHTRRPGYGPWPSSTRRTANRSRRSLAPVTAVTTNRGLDRRAHIRRRHRPRPQHACGGTRARTIQGAPKTRRAKPRRRRRRAEGMSRGRPRRRPARPRRPPAPGRPPTTSGNVPAPPDRRPGVRVAAACRWSEPMSVRPTAAPGAHAYVYGRSGYMHGPARTPSALSESRCMREAD